MIHKKNILKIYLKQKFINSQKEKLFKEMKAKRPKSIKIPNIIKVIINREQIKFLKKIL